MQSFGFSTFWRSAAGEARRLERPVGRLTPKNGSHGGTNKSAEGPGDKRKRNKDRMRHESHQRSLWRDGQEYLEFCAWKRERFWAERERAEHKTEVTEDGVIQGPWGEAS